jgi:hypothetical protein
LCTKLEALSIHAAADIASCISGPANNDLAPAEEGPMHRAISEAIKTEPPLTRNEMVLVDVGLVSQSSQEAEGADFLSPQQVPEPEKLEMLDETLLHPPYGSKDPYQFYHVLKVDIKATFPQIEVTYRKISMLYHPDRHVNDKDAWTAQFQILSTIKSTLTNTEERQKYNSQQEQIKGIK